MSLDVCPFCAAAVEWLEPDIVKYVYPFAHCACGGLGVSFGVFPDADEGAYELTSRLGLEAPPQPEPVPIGTSGMITAVPYDSPRTLAALEASLRSHGFTYALASQQFRNEVMTHERYAVWARRAAAT